MLLGRRFDTCTRRSCFKNKNYEKMLENPIGDKMRIQPPKNEDEFVGKNVSGNIELIISYIGSHRLIYKDGEKTVKEYLESNDWFNKSHVNGLLSMFPVEIQDLAKIYLEHKFKD